ncbi:hypothetical protein Tco_1372680 [Tanacetum coccineum]
MESVEKQNQTEEEQAANNDGLKGIQEFIEEAEKKPTIVVGIILSLVVVVVSRLLKIFLASKKKPVNVAPFKDGVKNSTTKAGEDATSPRRRNSKA